MKDLQLSLIRFKTKDGIELQGHLYESTRASRKIVIHIHGLVGNFYENLFVEEIAREVLRKGWSFLAFNNRGAGMVTEFIKTRASSCVYELIGGSVERFIDCVHDIDAAVQFAANLGYREMILQGHSLGCQKAAYYCAKADNKHIRGLIFLAPVDDVACAKMFLGRGYEAALKQAERLTKNGKETRLPKHMEFYPLMTAERFLDIASPKTIADALFDYVGPMKMLRKIELPVLAVFCTSDQYQPDSKSALATLKTVLKQCDTKLIAGGGHFFPQKEKTLAKTVAEWIKDNF